MSDWIAHRSYKYIKRARGKNGKYRYWYKNTSTQNGDRLAQSILGNMPEYQYSSRQVSPNGWVTSAKPTPANLATGIAKVNYTAQANQIKKTPDLKSAQDAYKRAHDFVQKYSKMPIVGGLVSLIGGQVVKQRRTVLNELIRNPQNRAKR